MAVAEHYAPFVRRFLPVLNDLSLTVKLEQQDHENNCVLRKCNCCSNNNHSRNLESYPQFRGQFRCRSHNLEKRKTRNMLEPPQILLHSTSLDIQEEGKTIFICPWYFFIWDQKYVFIKRYVDKIGKISKGTLFIYLRNKWTKRYPYLLPSAHITCRQNDMHEKWGGGHGSHGMFLPFILDTTPSYIPWRIPSFYWSVPNIFFIYFLEDIKDIFLDFVTLTERFCLQTCTPCAVKDGHIIAHLGES